MSIKDTFETRAKNRAAARNAADMIIGFLMQTIDTLPEETQAQVISMVMGELQVAQKKMEKKVV